MPLMSVAEYAAHRGVTPRTIRNAIKRADITPHRSGRIDSERADGAWAPSAAGRPKKPKAAPAEVPPPAPAPALKASPAQPPDPERTPPTAAERIKAIEAERAEVRWAVERKQYIDRAEVAKLLADFGHRIRAEMQSHPRKMQAAMTKAIRCPKCGSGVEGKIIAIEAERYTTQLLRMIADNPLGAHDGR